MLIQLGLFLIQIINWQDDEVGKDAKLEFIDYYIEIIDERINEEESNFNKKYGNDRNTKEAKAARKSVYDKYILLSAFKNIKENYLECGKAKINFL